MLHPQEAGRHASVMDATLSMAMNAPVEEKMHVLRLLEEAGVEVVKVGFPRASEHDFDVVHAAAQQAEQASVCAFARPREDDLSAAARALAPARRPRIVTTVSTSDHHLKHKMRMGRLEALEAIRFGVRRARELVGTVQWTAEDAARTEPAFLLQCVSVALQEGAQVIGLHDPYGDVAPGDWAELVRQVLVLIPAERVLSVRCADHRGTALTNTLVGMTLGARQAECSLWMPKSMLEMPRTLDVLQRSVESMMGMMLRGAPALLAKALCLLPNQPTLELETAPVQVTGSGVLLTRLTQPTTLALTLQMLGFELDEVQLRQVQAAFTKAMQTKTSMDSDGLRKLVDRVLKP